MKIQIKPLTSYIPVDLEKLRPNNSYGTLISKRNHNLDKIIEEYGNIPSDFLSFRNCPSCNLNSFDEELSKDGLKMVKCKYCTTIFVNPIFNERYYDETYKSKDYQKVVQDLGHSSHMYRVERFGKERVERMSQFIKKDEVFFLDVGCSTGFVVEAAKNANWKAEGIDLNPSAIEFGKKRGLDLDDIKLEQVKKNNYDAIGMFDVLEHVPNPKDILDQAYERLNPGGIIYVYVPNYNSASRVLMGADAHFIWPSHHLTLYTPETLKLQLENSKFEFEWFETEGLDVFDYIWYLKNKTGNDYNELELIANKIQFFINGSGYGKNLRMIARKK
jgi:2-polyprenyl-3-methyl-5-hydroxy-6-metoxy-1,4-benzoquinol methylase